MRATRAAAVAGAITALGIFGVASPALAVDRNCYDDYFCVYKDINYSTGNSMYRINVESKNWSYQLPSIYKADSSWRNFHDQTWRVCDYGTFNDTTTISLTNGQGITYSSGANDRGEGNQLALC
ncbi:hypothetical protein AB0J85_20425 [Micromonospora echinofusca]|uniref:hypothetical protein n=1 Tax=Micromonospora echinofusca TaxID=47858 RepID=UPI00342AA46D